MYSEKNRMSLIIPNVKNSELAHILDTFKSLKYTIAIGIDSVKFDN